jgi:hypothetical protein
VIAKTNLPQLLERELAALAHSGKLADATIFMSSATDPYQTALASIATKAACRRFRATVRHVQGSVGRRGRAKSRGHRTKESPGNNRSAMTAHRESDGRPNPQDRIGLCRGLDAPPEIIKITSSLQCSDGDWRRDRSGSSLLRRPDARVWNALIEVAHRQSDASAGCVAAPRRASRLVGCPGSFPGHRLRLPRRTGDGH